MMKNTQTQLNQKQRHSCAYLFISPKRLRFVILIVFVQVCSRAVLSLTFAAVLHRFVNMFLLVFCDVRRVYNVFL